MGNNYLGTGVNLLGWQIGPDQMAEFAKEMAAACGVSPEACRQVEDKWYQLSLKQSGLNEEGVAEWNKKLDATFTNLYIQCQGDSACTLYLELQKGLAKTTHLGMHGELAALGVSLKYAMDIKQGNWGALLLDGLNDFGAFIPAAATKPFEKGVEKIIAVGGEVFVKSKGVWTQAPRPIKAIDDALLNEANFAGQLPTRADLEKHFVKAEISGKQISGGHNMHNFDAVLQQAGGKIVSKTELAPGIYEVKYRLSGKNYVNQKTGVEVLPTKTVYDPSKYSDIQMSNMALEATARGQIQFQVTGDPRQYIRVGEVWFFVPVKTDGMTGKVIGVQTVYPSLPPRVSK